MGDERSANAIDLRLGQRVRARRLEIGMSQERLAELLGVTFQQVQKYEKGVNRIAASRLFDICNALDVSVARIFDGIGGSRPPALPRARETEVIERVLATSDGARLLTLFASVKSARARRRILDVVEAMAAEARSA